MTTCRPYLQGPTGCHLIESSRDTQFTVDLLDSNNQPSFQHYESAFHCHHTFILTRFVTPRTLISPFARLERAHVIAGARYAVLPILSTQPSEPRLDPVIATNLSKVNKTPWLPTPLVPSRRRPPNSLPSPARLSIPSHPPRIHYLHSVSHFRRLRDPHMPYSRRPISRTLNRRTQICSPPQRHTDSLWQHSPPQPRHLDLRWKHALVSRKRAPNPSGRLARRI